MKIFNCSKYYLKEYEQILIDLSQKQELIQVIPIFEKWIEAERKDLKSSNIKAEDILK